ncbi:TolB family protein [Streptomyces sp. G45]|uniref:TolB family protein n=1 Tax=Streptomyces sp. G45 TaxID=3406627 RepID=UPI003C14E940
MSSVERISVAGDGTQADGDSADASLTPDGRHVVFASAANNLTSDRPELGDEVFVRDQLAAQTRRIGYYDPLQPPALSGDGAYLAYPVQWMRDVKIYTWQVRTGAIAGLDCWPNCFQPSLNADGRYAAYSVTARPPAVHQRVEVQNMWTGAKEVIAEFDHTSPSRPSLSGDARYVAYQDGKAGDVFVRDRTGGTTSGPVEGPSRAATLVQLSDDGSKVVYRSGSDTYVHDVAAGTDQVVPNVRGIAIDPTGRYLLYAPNSSDGTSGPSPLTLRDLLTGTDEVLSERPASAGVDAVSANGRDVVFTSAADDVVPGDTNGKADVFVRRFE